MATLPKYARSANLEATVRWTTWVVAVAAVATAACSSGSGGTARPAGVTSASAGTRSSIGPTTQPPSASQTLGPAAAADAVLIKGMYDTINRAFRRNPDDGVRALIAAQDPEDRADVDFARCVSAIQPGAKALPPNKWLSFTPRLTTMLPDSGYTVTSDRVKGLHPSGRIYLMEVAINGNGVRPTVRERHQVVVGGKAYQFSAC